MLSVTITGLTKLETITDAHDSTGIEFNNDDNKSSKDLVVVKKEDKGDVKPIISSKKKESVN